MENRISLDDKPPKINIRDYTIILLIVALFLFLTFSTDSFFSRNNLYSLIYGVSIQFFAIIGFTLVLIAGEIDLTVGAMYGFSGTLVGALMAFGRLPFHLAVVAALTICTAIGFVIGALTVSLRLNSMMITLASMTLVQGINAVVFNRMSAAIYPASYRNFAKFQIGGVNWSIILMVIFIIVLEILLIKTAAFKKIYYTGQNNQTAKLYGIPVNKLKTLCFMASSFTAAFGGIIATSRITHSDIMTGRGLEFTIITACVIGGCSLSGGKGGILKAAAGLIFLAMLSNGMIIYRIEPFAQQVTHGIILVLAVFIDARMNRKQR